jgi:hypothetical protein
MSEVLRAEWRVHQTPFASRWLANLKARKRVAWLREPGPRLDILDAAVEVLTERQVEAVRDDLHVVELALSTDLRVLSDDRRQRELLVRLVERVPELGALAWVGAAMPGAPEWLGAGAPLGAPHRVSDGMTGA